MGKDYGRRLRLSPEEEALIIAHRDGNVRERWQRHLEYEEVLDEDGIPQLVAVGESWERGGVYGKRIVPGKNRRILVVGDLHAPFTRKDYFAFCKELERRYKTNHTVFIGDVIDNHYSSFWDADPDGLSAGDELELAIEELQKWHEAFPNADVTLGNHDVRIFRQMFRAGVSKKWMGRFADVLKTPTWNYTDRVEYDGVIYHHGGKGGAENGASNRAMKRGKSIVQGHHHTASYIKYHVTDTTRVFGMQVGCGIDEETYAAQYAKDMISRFIISAGVVLDDGQLPILELMRL